MGWGKSKDRKRTNAEWGKNSLCYSIKGLGNWVLYDRIKKIPKNIFIW